MAMAALGQKQTLNSEIAMSALPPKADIVGQRLDVRFVPLAEVRPFKSGAASNGMCRRAHRVLSRCAGRSRLTRLPARFSINFTNHRLCRCVRAHGNNDEQTISR